MCFLHGLVGFLWLSAIGGVLRRRRWRWIGTATPPAPWPWPRASAASPRGSATRRRRNRLNPRDDTSPRRVLLLEWTTEQKLVPAYSNLSTGGPGRAGRACHPSRAPGIWVGLLCFFLSQPTAPFPNESPYHLKKLPLGCAVAL